MTRPEIANTIWNLARFCENPGKAYYGKSAENVTQAIVTTKSLGISYGGIRDGFLEMSAYYVTRTTLHNPTSVGLNLGGAVHLGGNATSWNL